MQRRKNMMWKTCKRASSKWAEDVILDKFLTPIWVWVFPRWQLWYNVRPGVMSNCWCAVICANCRQLTAKLKLMQMSSSLNFCFLFSLPSNVILITVFFSICVKICASLSWRFFDAKSSGVSNFCIKSVPRPWRKNVLFLSEWAVTSYQWWMIGDPSLCRLVMVCDSTGQCWAVRKMHVASLDVASPGSVWSGHERQQHIWMIAPGSFSGSFERNAFSRMWLLQTGQNVWSWTKHVTAPE